MNLTTKSLFLTCLFLGCSISLAKELELLLSTYPSVIERLICFKRDKFKTFYGGPIDRKNGGIQWIMPVAFENEQSKTRAIYQIAFVNCIPETAQDAYVLFVDVS